MEKKITVQLIKSTIRKKPNQVKNLQSLGLRKIGNERSFIDNAAFRGILDKVKHLVKVTEK